MVWDEDLDFGNPKLLHLMAELGGGPTGGETQDAYNKMIQGKCHYFKVSTKFRAFQVDVPGSTSKEGPRNKERLIIRPDHIDAFLDVYKSVGSDKKQREEMVKKFKKGGTYRKIKESI